MQHLRLQGIDHPNLFPGVDAAAEDAQFRKFRFRDPQKPEHLLPQGGGSAAGGQLQIFNVQHGDTSGFSECPYFTID